MVTLIWNIWSCSNSLIQKTIYSSKNAKIISVLENFQLENTFSKSIIETMLNWISTWKFVINLSFYSASISRFFSSFTFSHFLKHSNPVNQPLLKTSYLNEEYPNHSKRSPTTLKSITQKFILGNPNINDTNTVTIWKM